MYHELRFLWSRTDFSEVSVGRPLYGEKQSLARGHDVFNARTGESEAGGSLEFEDSQCSRTASAI